MREELKNNLNIHFQIIYKDILDQNEILKLINKVLDLFENKDQGITEPNWSQKDIFLHVSALEKSKLRVLKEEQKIIFDIKEEKDKLQAINIKKK